MKETEVVVLNPKSWVEYFGVRYENRTNIKLRIRISFDVFELPCFSVEVAHEEGKV